MSTADAEIARLQRRVDELELFARRYAPPVDKRERAAWLVAELAELRASDDVVRATVDASMLGMLAESASQEQRATLTLEPATVVLAQASGIDADAALVEWMRDRGISWPDSFPENMRDGIRADMVRAICAGTRGRT